MHFLIPDWSNPTKGSLEKKGNKRAGGDGTLYSGFLYSGTLPSGTLPEWYAQILAAQRTLEEQYVGVNVPIVGSLAPESRSEAGALQQKVLLAWSSLF